MRCAFAIAVLFALSACGGSGGTASFAPIAHPTAAAKNATLTVTITFPSAANAKTSALKRIYSTASETAGIVATLYPHGSSPSSAVAITGADISGDAGSSCTVSGTGRTCSFSISAPAGNSNDLLVQTYDQIVPASGTPPSGAHLLAAGTQQNVAITAGTSNSVTLSLNPVVSTVSLSTIPTSLHTLIPGHFTLSVYAFDAAGNQIIAGQYVDANGNPVTLSIAQSTNPNNSISLSTSTVGNSSTIVTGSYKATADVLGNSTLPVTFSVSSPVSASATLTLVGPSVTPVVGLTRLAGQPPNYPNYANAVYIPVNGIDPQLWLDAFSSTSGCIEAVDLSTSSEAACYVGTPGPSGGLAYGFNTAFAPGAPTPYFVTTSPLGGITSTSCSSCSGTGGAAFVSAIDTLYFIAGGNLVSYTNPTSAALLTTLGSVSGTPEGESADPNQHIFAATNSNLYFWDGTTLHTASNPLPSMLDVLAVGPGEAYVTDPVDGQIADFSYSAPTLSSALTFPTVLGKPYYLVESPTGLSTWFSESTPAGLGIGRIDTSTKDVGESQIITGGIPGGIIATPGADIYYVVWWSNTSSPGEILRVQP